MSPEISVSNLDESLGSNCSFKSILTTIKNLGNAGVKCYTVQKQSLLSPKPGFVVTAVVVIVLLLLLLLLLHFCSYL